MGFLVAGILAAAVSWVGNRAALKLMGPKVIVAVGPFIEELAKNGAAILTGSPLVLTHGVFGLAEGIYDAWDAGFQGLKAGLASLLGHVFYGYLTALVFHKYRVFWPALLTGYTVHMLWNVTVMQFMVTKKGVAR